MPSFITFGQQTEVFCPKFILGYMRGGRWAWPILVKLSILLIIIIEMTYAKFHNFWSANRNFLTKIHFGLYGRWAVGVADFDKTFPISYYRSRDDLCQVS